MKSDEYQRQMQVQCDRTAPARLRDKYYTIDAAAEFKREYWPADPFDGVWVNASFLDVPDLVAVHRADHVMKSQGKVVFPEDLIQYLQGQWVSEYNWRIIVKVNPLWVDANCQRKLEISHLLQEFYKGTTSSFRKKREEILDMGDDQLVEMVRQVEEALGLTAQELEVIVGES